MKNENSPAQTIPYERFSDFIKDGADRYAILTEYIEKLKLNSAVIPVEQNRHIFIFPPDQKPLRASGVFPFRGQSPYLLCAHYDRVEGSPGANDNSAAVFHLLNAAENLIARRAKNWLIVFTDKEEIKAGETLEDQGSFSLAKKIKSWGLEKARIYNFDCCGAGEVFIISTITDRILKDSGRPNIEKIRRDVKHLRDHALATADSLRFDKVLLAPTPFSDDVGFLRAGLASQTITILPAQEAEKYEALLRRQPDFADLIISGRIKMPEEKRNLPETWKNINNAGDTPSRLTPQHFSRIVGFMAELCVLKQKMLTNADQ
ncbi:MAG: M28 family metallopeptidase [Treponema sp.]|nr:M28 family metallopeptidase [Treponema sp.]